MPHDAAAVPLLPSLADQDDRPYLSGGEKVSTVLSCARLCYWPEGLPAGGERPELAMQSLGVHVDVHISHAVVRVSATFANRSGSAQPLCLFEAPLGAEAAPTSCSVTCGGRQLETMVCEPTGVRASPAPPGSSAEALGQLCASYNPEVFRLPVTDVPDGGEVAVALEYLQPLGFEAGRYHLTVPMTFSDVALALNPGLLQGGTSVSCRINSGTPYARWGSSSHPNLAVVPSNAAPSPPWPRSIALQSDARLRMPNADFVVSYFAWVPATLATCLIEPPPTLAESGKVSSDVLRGPLKGRGFSEYDGRGTFAVFVTPPQPETVAHFGRSVAFVIDQSYSMGGPPMRAAKEALCLALDALGPLDCFAICAFDDKEFWYDAREQRSEVMELPAPGLAEGARMEEVTPEAVEQAKRWVRGAVKPNGCTDIATPMGHAKALLLERRRLDEAELATRGGGGAQPRLPVMLLLTDGAVSNEKQICNEWQADAAAAPIRLLTFGIGSYCNHYFLKMLSFIGRGFCEVVMRNDQQLLQRKIYGLMARTFAPCLVDITVGIAGLKDCEIYPFPIPDLFCGAPVLIVGKYSGRFPAQITLSGRLASGQQQQIPVPVLQTAPNYVPINRVFVKTRLDLLVAKAWLCGDGEQADRLRAQAAALSVRSKVACPHTVMVAVETSAEKWDKRRGRPRSEGKGHGGMGTAGGIAAAAVGGVFVIGAAAAAVSAFGSSSATASNLVSSDAMSALLTSGDDALSSLGTAFGDGFGEVAACCECLPGALGEGCGELCAGSEALLGGCFGNCGDLCGTCGGELVGCFGGLFENVSSCAEALFGTVQGACQQCACDEAGSDIVGGVSSCCTGALGEGLTCITGLFAPMAECVGNIGSAAGDCVSSCNPGELANLCADGCSNLGDAASGGCSVCGDVVSGCGGAAGGCVEAAGGLLGGAGDCLQGVGSVASGALDCVAGIVGDV